MTEFNKLTPTSFGFTVVTRKPIDYNPQLVASTIEGIFRISTAISEELGISVGDNIMFFNNISNINKAIESKVPELVEYCKRNHLNIDSTSAANAIHKEFDIWAIAKGIAEYNKRGEQKLMFERLSEDEKISLVLNMFDELYDRAMTDGDEETKTALTRIGIDKYEQARILSDFIRPKPIPKYKGSKTYSQSNSDSSANIILAFKDLNVWKQLKYDLAEPTKVNRIFDIDINDSQSILVNNGKEDVIVKALTFGQYYIDKEPTKTFNNFK